VKVSVSVNVVIMTMSTDDGDLIWKVVGVASLPVQIGCL